MKEGARGDRGPSGVEDGFEMVEMVGLGEVGENADRCKVKGLAVRSTHTIR